MLQTFNRPSDVSSQLSDLSSQSGRSLVEVIGVMALAAVMLVGTFQIYRIVTTRMHRMETTEDLNAIAKNSRLMFAGRGDYSNISVPYLIKSGAIKTDKPPRIARSYMVQSESGGKEFSITLIGLNKSDCVWEATQHFEWELRVSVNDTFENPAEACTDDNDNKVTIYAK